MYISLGIWPRGASHDRCWFDSWLLSSSSYRSVTFLLSLARGAGAPAGEAFALRETPLWTMIPEHYTSVFFWSSQNTMASVITRGASRETSRVRGEFPETFGLGDFLFLRTPALPAVGIATPHTCLMVYRYITHV